MLQKIVNNSPLVVGLVQSAIAVAIAFGWEITDVQTGAIIGALGALMALLGVLISPNVPIGIVSPASEKDMGATVAHK